MLWLILLAVSIGVFPELCIGDDKSKPVQVHLSFREYSRFIRSFIDVVVTVDTYVVTWVTFKKPEKGSFVRWMEENRYERTEDAYSVTEFKDGGPIVRYVHRAQIFPVKPGVEYSNFKHLF